MITLKLCIIITMSQVKFLCQGLECNSSSNPHYLLHLPGQTCEIDIRGERSPVYRKPTHDEAYRFPRNIEGEVKCVFYN